MEHLAITVGSVLKWVGIFLLAIVLVPLVVRLIARGYYEEKRRYLNRMARDATSEDVEADKHPSPDGEGRKVVH